MTKKVKEFNTKTDLKEEEAVQLAEEMENCETIRKAMKELYMGLKSTTQNKKIDEIVKSWKEIASVVVHSMPSVRLFVFSMKITGDVYLEFDEFEKAKNYYLFFVTS